MSTVNIKDIAQICGVGISTVSRVLNNHSDVSDKTKEKVLEAMKKYHYIPNNSARNLRLNKTKSIAILVPAAAQPFHQNLLAQLQKEIQTNNYTPMLHQLETFDDEINTACSLVKEKNLEGIIFVGGNFHDKADELKSVPVPFVIASLSTEPNLFDKCSSVSINDSNECYKAISHLCQLGHKNIAAILPRKSDPRSNRCLDGFKQALADHSLQFREELIQNLSDNGFYHFKNGLLCTQKLLAESLDFTALFAISDVLAIGACKALEKAGKSVPGDVSVMGYDNMELSEYYIPALTTISQPIGSIARKTAQMLFDIIESGDFESHQQVLFSCSLVERESCRPL